MYLELVWTYLEFNCFSLIKLLHNSNLLFCLSLPYGKVAKYNEFNLSSILLLYL